MLTYFSQVALAASARPNINYNVARKKLRVCVVILFK